jgi:hypothetical protein
MVEVWNGARTLILGAPTSVRGDPDTVAIRDDTGALVASTYYGNSPGNAKLDGNAKTASLATDSLLLQTQNGAYYRSRVNHTGTQLSSSISDFTSRVNGTTLDQLQPPVIDVDFNNFKIRQLNDPVLGTDAANKQYVDSKVTAQDSLYLSFTVYDPTKSGKVKSAVNSDTLAGFLPGHFIDRSYHTGTQLSNTISDFNSQVQKNRLNSMAPPTGNIAMAGFKITVLGPPGTASDAATKGYVDTSIAGIPPPEWQNITGRPLMRPTLTPLPNLTDTGPPDKESIGYDRYFFRGVNLPSTQNWRQTLTVPFRAWKATPVSSSATGALGDCAFDTTYFYFCVGTNAWKRIAFNADSTWAGMDPFIKDAAVPQGYTYSDGRYFFIAIADNTWKRFTISSFSGISSGVPVPTDSYYPGLPGMETFDSGFWYVCTDQNLWRRAGLISF